MDDDDLDDDFFTAIDKMVQKHNDIKAQTQRTSQLASPHADRLAAAQQHRQQQLGQSGQAPNGTLHFRAAPNGRPAAVPAALPCAAAPRGGLPTGPPVGRVTAAAAQFRAQAAAAPAESSGGSHNPPAQLPCNPQRPAQQTHPHPQQQQPAQAGHLQSQLSRLQQALATQEGTNKLLRTNLEQVDRDRATLKQRIVLLEARSGSGGRQQATVGEMLKQMDQLKQQMMFKDQELEDFKRQQAAKVGELRGAHEAVASLRAEIKRLTAGGAPQPAAHASPLLPSAFNLQHQSPQPPQQQNQQVPKPAAGQKRRHADVAGTSVAVQAAAPMAAPLLNPSALAAVKTAANGPASLVAHLWTACPDCMSLLMGFSPSAPGPATELLPPLQSLLHGTTPEHQQLLRLRALDSGAAQFTAAFAQKLPRVASAVQPAVSLLDDLAAFVAKACIDHHQQQQEEVAPKGHRLSPAGAALVVMGQLVSEDTACREAALASCGCTQPVEPERFSFRAPLPPAGAPFGRHSAGVPALPQLEGLISATPAAFAGAGAGLLALTVQAARLLGSRHRGTLSGSLGLSAALASVATPGDQRSALLPLLTSDAVKAFLQEPALRLPAAKLLHLLLEDAAVGAATGSSAAAAASRVDQSGGATPGPASAAKRRAAGSTPLTRAAAARLAAEEESGREAQAMKGVEPMQGEPAAQEGGWIGGGAVLEALVDCLALPAASSSSDWCALPRAAMAVIALLREQGQDACLNYLLQESTGGGVSLPVRLVQLAEAAVAHQGPDAPVTPVMTAAWPEGSCPAARDAQVAWQRRLRVAQEALTLLRGLVFNDSTAGVATEELLCNAAPAREMVAATTRLSKMAGPSEEEGSAQQMLPALPLAAWARAIGSSSAAPSVSSADGGKERGGLPCCSFQDVAYMALRLRRLLLA